MVIVAINDKDKIVREAKLPSSDKALNDFFDTFTEPVQTVAECTNFWYWLSDWCRTHDISLTLAHSKYGQSHKLCQGKNRQDGRQDTSRTVAGGPHPRSLSGKTGSTRTPGVDPRALANDSVAREAAVYAVGVGRQIQCNIGDYGWRQLGKLQDWLQPQLPEAANLQAKLMLGQISQLQTHIHQIEQEIDQQTTFDKDGNKYLRAAFGQAAVSAYTHYKVVKTFYRKIKRRSGCSIARAVVAKELAKCVWHMLTKDEQYKGFKGQPTRVASKAYWPQPISPTA